MSCAYRIGLLCAIAILLGVPHGIGQAAESGPKQDQSAAGRGEDSRSEGFLDYEEPQSPEPLGTGGLFRGLVLPLIAVVALIYVVAWFLKKKMGVAVPAVGKNKLTQVVEVMPLGGQKCVYLVRVVDRLMVLGVTDDGISSLGEISEDELSHSVEGGLARDFGSLLASLAGREEQAGSPRPVNAATAEWKA